MKVLRILAAMFVFTVIAGGAVYLMREEIINWWLQRQLAARLSRISGAHVEMEHVRYRDGVLSAERCRVSGGNMAFAFLEIGDAKVPIDWERIKNPAGEPLRIEAASVDLVWRNAARGEADEELAARAQQDGATLPIVEMVVGNFSFRREDSSGWRIADTAVRGKLDAGVWSFSGDGGYLHAPGWPAFAIERLAGQHRPEETIIENFALREPDGGRVEGSAKAIAGEWSGDFRWENVGMNLLLPESVTKHFTARCSGNARLAGSTLAGQMELDGAEARNLPALVKLASIFTGEDYGTVPWQSARFDFTRDSQEAVRITNLTAISPKGLAVRGSGLYTKDSLAADLQLGVAREGRPWLVAFMPVLFRTEKEGYLWASVKVGGTPQAPTENLTPRVVAALAAAPATQAVETAVEIPATAVEAAGGLLRSLLGR